MQYNISQLIQEPTGSKRTYEINEDSFDVEGFDASDIKGQILLTKTDIGIWLRGVASLMAQIECVRCLEYSSKKIDVKIEAQFYPSHLKKDETFGIDESFSFDSDKVLDITDAFRQSVITNASMKPLCFQNCMGLCQSCGIIRNYDKCSCVDKLIDVRWKNSAHFVNSFGVDSIKV